MVYYRVRLSVSSLTSVHSPELLLCTVLAELYNSKTLSFRHLLLNCFGYLNVVKLSFKELNKRDD